MLPPFTRSFQRHLLSDTSLSHSRSPAKMSTPNETQTMRQMRYRVKQLMEEVLAGFQKKEALLKKSNLWKDLQKLHDKILEVQSFIGDCGRENQVKLMEEIEEKVYLTGDFLDEVAFRVLEWEHDSDTRRKVLTSTSQTPETKGMSETLDKIKASLENLTVEARKNNLQPGVIHGSDLTFKRELELHKSPRSSQENVKRIRRSEEFEKLINVLLEPGKDEGAPLQIIPIVGQEGIGKTTLARAAYDHKQIQDHFDLRIWVCVSTSIEAKWTCGKILEALAPNRRVELDSADEILALLLEELGGKSFFLALDDVSGTEADLPRLKLLKDCLLRLNTTRRNKIVITTCSSEIAEEIKMHNHFHLQKLSDDDCMAIFNKKAFEGVQQKDIEKSINLARGIPLAAKVLGAAVNNSKEWQTLAESVINDKDTINIPEEDWPIFRALHLSYLHLPLDARQCFSYMSMFPPNTSIETDNIIQLWVAEGFFQSYSLIDMEDKWKECLHILLYMCLIESAERDCYGDISSVRLGRTAWKLASHMLDPTDHRRRVSVHAQQRLVQAPENAELHTFFSVGNDVSYGNYKFGHLKVLSLSKSRFKTWPDALENLKLLRHLDVSGTTVTELPELISKLFYLETIRATNCSFLGKLPTNISALKSLRHFCIDADNEAIRKAGKFPLGLYNLTSLQTLPLLIVSEKPSEREELLGPLKKLRGKLTVCNLERLTSKEAKGWMLMEKDGISELRFEWSMNTQQTSNHMEVLDKLQPNNKLKRLTLKNFGGDEISMWKKAEAVGPDSVSLTNLVKLKLSNCNNCKKLPVLGTLPFLAELHIEGMENLDSIGSDFYMDKTTGTTGAEESRAKLFAVLRKLSLMYLANLKSWSKAEVADNEVFPLLEELRIEGCDALSSAPSHFQSLRKLHYESVSSGVPLANICSNLTTLTSVMISSVSDLQDLPEGVLKTNPSLSSLQICNCPMLTQIPNPGTWSCSNSLRSLTIFECEKLESLPENLQSVSSLIELILGQCHGLKSIPSLGGLSSLRRLKIEWCSGLEKLPSGLESCTSLEHLTIKGCPSLTSVQDEGFSKLTSLCSLNILGCDKLTALPFRELLHYLTKLRRLEIEGFTEETLGLTIEYPGLMGWARFKALPEPFQSKKIKGAWTIDPELLPAFATKAVGFLEAMQLFEERVKAVKP